MESITVTQETNLGLIVPQTTYNLSQEVQTLEVEVQSNVDYSVSIDPSCKDWITQVKTKALSADKVSFKVAANSSYDKREGIVSILQNKGELKSIIHINQKASNIVFEDAFVEECLVELYDLDNDGGISKEEAECVTVLSGDLFWHSEQLPEGGYGTSRPIRRFNELQYFTSLTEIPRHCFRTSSLESVILPPSIRTIQEWAFFGCSSLTNIEFPNNLEEIELRAFSNCTALESIILPEGLSVLGDYAFTACVNAKTISLPSSLNSLPFCCFQSCLKVESVVFPEGITNVGQAAFYMCHALHEVQLPESLTVIMKDAFADCDLEAITIPQDVSYIGQNAFGYMPYIQKVTILCETPPDGEGYYFQPGEFPIYVPAQSVGLYKSSQAWSEYVNQIRAIGN